MIEDLNIPHLDQYAGVYAMHEPTFQSLLNQVRTPDLLRAHVEHARSTTDQTQQAADDRKPYRMDGGVAMIRLVGPMTKYGSSLAGPGTVGVRRAVRSAARDKDVQAVMLLIDSPGGMTAGTDDLAQDVADAATTKPVTAFIEDLGASAAYWVASQATRIVANRSSLVGSIGTYMVIQDLHRLAENAGVVTHVIRAGAFKGVGAPGTEITDAQLAEFQRIVDQINAQFLGGVARGRKMDPDQLAELADGRVHTAADAMEMGLIDAVARFDTTLADLKTSTTQRRGQSPRATQEDSMTANSQQIRAACPGADADFVLQQLDAKATPDQAKDAWIAKQAETIQALRSQLTEAKDAADKAQAEAEDLRQQAKSSTKPGAPSLPDGQPPQPGAGDARTQWDALVAEKVAAGLNRPEAICAVAKGNPELHQAYLEQHNATAHHRGG